jgi:hypothetical protein
MGLNKKRVTKASTIQFDNSDPLWNETPKIGVEGLIAIIDDEDELRQKLIESSEYQKKLKRGESI